MPRACRSDGAGRAWPDGRRTAGHAQTGAGERRASAHGRSRAAGAPSDSQRARYRCAARTCRTSATSLERALLSACFTRRRAERFSASAIRRVLLRLLGPGSPTRTVERLREPDARATGRQPCFVCFAAAAAAVFLQGVAADSRSAASPTRRGTAVALRFAAFACGGQPRCCFCFCARPSPPLNGWTAAKLPCCLTGGRAWPHGRDGLATCGDREDLFCFCASAALRCCHSRSRSLRCNSSSASSSR